MPIPTPDPIPDTLDREIGAAAREGVSQDIGLSMSPERKTLAAAMSRAAGELPQSDPQRIIQSLSQVKARAEQNITSIRDNRSAIDGEYERFKAAADLAEESQQRTIAMIDAALEAGEPKRPPRKKRQRKSRTPATEATAKAAPAVGTSTEAAPTPAEPAAGLAATSEGGGHDGGDFRGE